MTTSSAAGGPTKKQWTAFSKILKTIGDRPDAEPFRVPVAWKELGLTDYPQLIKKPMDLGTVKTKIDAGKYSSINDAADDVRLVWKNCMTYNADGSDFFLLAKALSKRFEDKYSKFVTEQGIDILKTSKAGGGGGSGSSAAGGGGGAAGAGAGGVITLDEKKMFARSLYKISKEDLGKIIVEIDSKCPMALIKSAGEDEAELNVDKIPADIFNQLKTYVADCTKNPGGAAKKKK
mmetsp:Transcript_34666/g.83734  ORF Transcript_34666/g.83734 Transcript_34666/m.83734 type:complete len:234 (-) Transcript_34666:329-1030(-)